ncbi:MAG: prepilin peptidase [Microbacterium sp.]|nr:prepilin peptidase [Microbacterium sp.]
MLSFAAVTAVGAVLGWRLAGVRARFAGVATNAPVDGLPFAAATAAAFLGVVAFVATRPPAPASAGGAIVPTVIVAVAYLYFAAISLLLGEIDAATHRLPNAIVLPAYPVLGALFASACLAGGSWSAFGRAAAGGGLLFGFFWLVRAVGRGTLGGGDVKLAGVIGMVLGFAGWPALAVGTLAAFVFGGVAAAVLLLRGKATRHTAVAFGPFLLAGAWAGLLATGAAALG